MPHNRYGIIGSGVNSGFETLERDFPGAEVTGNIIIGGKPERYPPGNQFPTSVDLSRVSAGVDYLKLCLALRSANPSMIGDFEFCAFDR
jgi:hypothetical protein